MAWGFEVTEKKRDGFNILAVMKYTDGKSAPIIETFPVAVDAGEAVDDLIANQAYKRIKNVLEAGDVTLAAITVGPGTVPDALKVDEKQQAVDAASRKLQLAAQRAQLVKLSDPDVTAALAEFEAAQDAVAEAVEAVAVSKG